LIKDICPPFFSRGGVEERKKRAKGKRISSLLLSLAPPYAKLYAVCGQAGGGGAEWWERRDTLFFADTHHTPLEFFTLKEKEIQHQRRKPSKSSSLAIFRHMLDTNETTAGRADIECKRKIS